ncbi:zinc finger and BTB domain-containing protein 45-like isoform X2 [Homarus americanus]|uniref:zinc finger and BTB domain-containing protein 45-like isoform X2 n=1 Tax=Homarus americanus TaxID=6706 RepID=UPI001C492499|nr:zinc finger and BTB domain-containing protein 45-like isoform X2 [Homarus americanus]
MEDSGAMTANAQEFCLRWNNFHSSLVTALDGFKNDQDFVDVTLACEGQFLKAHKMLLSACSVFFRDLLKANPCQHPIVILPPEVRFADLEKLLRFIYQGEVNVHQENLARFLKTAEMLKIRGLAEDSEKQRVLRSSSPRPPEGCDSDSVSPKRPRLSIDVHQPTQEPQTPNDDSRLSGGDSDSEMIPVKQEMVELKECSDSAYEGGEGEAFIPEAYLREGGPASSSSQQSQQQQAPPNAPPPPGPLLPSYVPPPQVKTQDDSPLGPTAPDELSQGTFARLVADHLGSAGGVHKSPGQGRSPVNTRSPGYIWSPGQGLSPSLIRSPSSPSGGYRSKGPSQFPQPKSQTQQQSTIRSPGTSGCSTPSGRSPTLDGHSPSLTPSPLASLMPNLSNISGSSPTFVTSGAGIQPTTTVKSVATTVTTPVTCDICNKTFTSRSNLNKHKRVQHSGEEYVCPICRRTFRNRYYIKEHVLLCSTATQKKAAAAAASVVIGVSTTQGGIGPGRGEEEEEDVGERKFKTEDFDGLEDEQPTDLVLRRPASPT